MKLRLSDVVRIIVSGIILLYSPPLAAIAVSIWIIYKIVRRFRPLASFSSFQKLIVSLVIYSVILQCVILLMWVPFHSISLTASSFITLGILAIGAVSIWKLIPNKLTSKTETSKALSRADIWAIAVASVILAIIIVPPMKDSIAQHIAPSQFIGSLALDYMTNSLDDGNHFGMFSDRAILDRGVLYNSGYDRLATSQPTISSYPVSWHASNVVLTKALLPNMVKDGQIIVSYVISKLFWFWMLCYMFAILALTAKLKPSNNASSHFLTGSLLLFFGLLITTPIFIQGFYSFIPALLYLLMSCFILTKVTDHGSIGKLILITLLGTGATLSWTLLAPVYAFTIIYETVSSIKMGRKKRENVWKYLLAVGTLCMCAGALGLQVLLMTRPGTRSFDSGINDPGAIAIYSMFVVIFIIAFAYTYFHRASKEVRDNLLPLLASYLLVCVFIFGYQTVTTGHEEYYYYKALIGAVITLTPFAIAAIHSLLAKYLLSQPRPTRALYVAGVVSTLVIVLGINPTNTVFTGFFLGSRDLSPSMGSYVYKHAQTTSKHTNTPTYLLYTPASPNIGAVSSTILRATTVYDRCYDHVFPTLFSNDPTNLATALTTCRAESAPITIITTDKDKQKVTDAIKESSPTDLSISVTSL